MKVPAALVVLSLSLPLTAIAAAPVEGDVIACAADGELWVLPPDLSRILVELKNGEAATVPANAPRKKVKVRGDWMTFVQTQFPRLKRSGWVDESKLAPADSCRYVKQTLPKPVPQPEPKPVPTPVPTPTPQPEPKPTPGNGEACAERLILVAAKKNVADNYDNSPSSGGYCAMGVRTSLQKSRVGNIQDGLGNAIDYLRTLPPHGFLLVGQKDPRAAAPGAVIVFSGPHTPSYLHNGGFGSPAGDWLGHVTIKGDDRFYYTDGRTREPAIGWSGGVNQAKRRNVAGIFVPGPALAAAFDGKCKAIENAELILDLALSTHDVLDDASLEAESRLTAERALARIAVIDKEADRGALFRGVLKLGREAGPFDDEGQLTQAIAKAIVKDSSLQPEFDSYVLSTRGNADPCKTDRLVAAVSQAVCLERARVQGQDSDAAASCIRPYHYSSCLKSSGL